MQQSNQPPKIQLPFANAGTRNTIPVPSQIGVTPGAASFTDGFPPLTMTPLSSGGIAPDGADFNGIFNAITAVQQWQGAGGMFSYDAAFSSANGGYPKGALLVKADGSGFWVSTADNNTTNPDNSGANWVSLITGADLGTLSRSVIQRTVAASGTRTVTLSDAGTMFSSASPTTYTLPDATTVTGMAVGFFSRNSSQNNVTINTVNSQLISIDNKQTQSWTLEGFFENMTLFSDGTEWLPIAGTPMALANRFYSGNGTYGYTSVGPNDFLLQWYVFNKTSTAYTILSFPIAFPSACFAISAVGTNYSGSPLIAQVSLLSNTQCNLGLFDLTGNQASGQVLILAFGW